MPRFDRTPQRSFAGGEQSPDLDARADLARWKTALQTCENFVIKVTGGVTRRSGLRDINAALSASTLVPFASSVSDGYAIECAATKCRFYRDYSWVESSPGVIYELTTPFTSGEIPNLRYAQSVDKMFIATGARAVQQLTHISSASWTIADAVLKRGPFLTENATQSAFLYTTATGEITTGTSFTIKAVGGTPFQSGHVGALFRIAINDGAKHGQWMADHSGFVVGSICRWGGNTYICDAIEGDNTGLEPPIHTVGSEWDGGNIVGMGGRLWRFLHSGWGVVKVTSYTSSAQVDVTAQTYIPDEVQATETAGVYDTGSGGIWRWSEGAFSSVRGYPAMVALHKKRLYLGSTAYQPTTLWASVIDDYINFENGTDADKGFTITLEADTGRVNILQWMVSGKRLGIGTSGDEHVLDSATPGQPIQPDTVDVSPGTTEGSASVPAVNVDGPVFISKNGRRIHELGYDFQTDAFVAPELTMLADHMAGDNGGKFTGLAWQRDPYRILWASRDDGVLAACTYRSNQNIQGWHRHPTVKGTVECICTVPNPNGSVQDLWAIVTRTCNGGTARRVESLMPFFEEGDHDITEAFFADGAVYYNGAPATVISGIHSHMNGEAVAVLADGKVVRGLSVVSGAVTLPLAASKVIIGLPLTSLLKTLRFDKDVEGALNGNKVRAQSANVDVLRSAGVEVAAGENDFELLTPSGGQTMDQPSNLQTGILEIDTLPSDWELGDISLRCADPLPATIRAIIPHEQVSR